MDDNGMKSRGAQQTWNSPGGGTAEIGLGARAEAGEEKRGEERRASKRIGGLWECCSLGFRRGRRRAGIDEMSRAVCCASVLCDDPDKRAERWKPAVTAQQCPASPPVLPYKERVFVGTATWELHCVAGGLIGYDCLD
ncbi:hypothetical protein TgHK011_000109 [Trichoderma gracile]|nr:hypothetical protein TgHK011_000109 [Trichoderma gracile]